MVLEFVGTGHIIGKSVDDVRNAVMDQRPDIVAVELDIRRYKALEEVSFDPGRYGDRVGLSVVIQEFVRGGGSFPVFIQYVLGLIQQDMGTKTGVNPGSDMCAALSSARFMGIRVSLIDRDIDVTLNRFFTIPLREVFGFFRKDNDLGDISGLVSGNIEDILEKENLEKVMDELKKKAPETHKAFVDERDQYMAYQLHNLQKQNPDKKILAVVGAGHEKGIREYVKKIDEGYEPDIESLTSKKALNPLTVCAVLLMAFAAFFLTKAQSITHKT